MEINVKNFFKGNVWARFNSLKIYFKHFVNLETRFGVAHKLKILSNFENEILKK
jgi:hypothetical protein